MDFLDPRKRRSHRLRLMFGYGLITVAIGLATTILVYGAYGYSIDTKTGGIVQNGLLFMDSKPGNAGIYLDGKYLNSTTAARLILPAKDYEVALKKSGYRDWKRNFTLEEHTIARYVYPFLFPIKPSTTALKSYPSVPGIITQSPDRRWLLLQTSSPRPGVVVFDEFDTSDRSKPARLLSLPQNLLSGAGTLTEVEWSSDNNHILLRHDYQGTKEFALVDRREPSQSINLNRVFSINPTQVALHDKKVDKLYIYDGPAQTLRLGNIRGATIEPVLIGKVLAFKPYGTNLISYATDNQMPAGQISLRIWDNQKSYQLSSTPAADKYLIDAAQFRGSWYYIAGSSSLDIISIFKNPLNDLKDTAIAKATPMANFRISGATDIEFSTNARFIGVQGAQKFVVYDFEEDKRYQYSAPSPLNAPLRWMDGHRLMGTSAGQLVVWDYDSTNRQVLIPTSLAKGGYFSGDFNQIFTLAPAVDGASGIVLQIVEMRAGEDLPAKL